MHILQIAAGDFFSTYGGGQVYVKNIVDEMIVHGYDISIISSTSVNAPEEKSYKGHRLIEIPASISLRELETLIRELSPDVIHAHSMKDIACKAGRELNVPVVITAHHGGILCPAGTRMDCNDRICHNKVNHKDCLPCVLRQLPGGNKLWHPLMKFLPQKEYLRLGQWLEKKLFILLITPLGSAARYIENKKHHWHDIAEYSTRIIAPCKKLADALILNGADKNKVTVIPHGIPLPDTRHPYPEIKEGKIKFYYVGRICYVKGIHVLLNALSRLDNSEIELHLIGGAGNRHERRYMEQLQKKYKSDSRIIWHRKVAPEEVYTITRDFHVSVSVPICLEAFGLNIAEALALGKPVLSSISGGGEQQIEDGVNGWLVTPNDAKALAAKMREIIANPELLPTMASNCHAISIADHVDSLTAVYKNIIKR